jgi:hypothetical protein
MKTNKDFIKKIYESPEAGGANSWIRAAERWQIVAPGNARGFELRKP